MTNTTLQVTNFNFYGDGLIALRDNATGKVYTSINSVLRGFWGLKMNKYVIKE